LWSLELSIGGVEALIRIRCISFYLNEAVHVCGVELSIGGVEALTRIRCISFYFNEAVHVCGDLSYLMEELRPSQGSDV